MVRRKVEAGSSSMFNAAGYLFLGERNAGETVRQQIALEVAANPGVYDEELVRTVDTIYRVFSNCCDTVVFRTSVGYRLDSMGTFDAFRMFELTDTARGLTFHANTVVCSLTRVDKRRTSIARWCFQHVHLKQRLGVPRSNLCSRS